MSHRRTALTALSSYGLVGLQFVTSLQIREDAGASLVVPLLLSTEKPKRRLHASSLRGTPPKSFLCRATLCLSPDPQLLLNLEMLCLQILFVVKGKRCFSTFASIMGKLQHMSTP